MIDFLNLDSYKENNRLEAKKATGGLPKSVWETCSAFANTMGGVILLGVEEEEDKSLHPVDLPDPEEMAWYFLQLAKVPEVIFPEVIRKEHVNVIEVQGKKIIAIEVPEATAEQIPVFIGGDPYSGSYFRNGDGDYQLEREDVERMLQDHGEKLFLDEEI